MTPSEKKHAVFSATENEDLKNFVDDQQRPRMNEAALVAGTNPELGYFLAKSRGDATPYDEPPLQDRTLQQALDLLRTKRFLELDKPEKNAER